MDELWEPSEKKALLKIGGHWIEKCFYFFLSVIFVYVQWDRRNLLLTEYVVSFKV